jgi:hypothetical protein
MVMKPFSKNTQVVCIAMYGQSSKRMLCSLVNTYRMILIQHANCHEIHNENKILCELQLHT